MKTVYPRAYGGTSLASLVARIAAEVRSIPARTGEPSLPMVINDALASVTGLSPRVRGNLMG